MQPSMVLRQSASVNVCAVRWQVSRACIGTHILGKSTFARQSYSPLPLSWLSVALRELLFSYLNSQPLSFTDVCPPDCFSLRDYTQRTTALRL
jgi:hypothetical protein